MFKRFSHNHDQINPMPSDRELDMMRAAIRTQPEKLPPYNIRLNLLAQAKPQAIPVLRPIWTNALSTLAFTFAIMIVLWLAVKPGLAMQWTTSLSGVAQYQVYRQEVGNSELELVGQLSPSETVFKDQFLVPGKTYTYTVKGVMANGTVISSQQLTMNSLGVLPGQLALILASLILGFSVTHWLTPLSGRAGFNKPV